MTGQEMLDSGRVKCVAELSFPEIALKAIRVAASGRAFIVTSISVPKAYELPDWHDNRVLTSLAAKELASMFNGKEQGLEAFYREDGAVTVQW